MTPDHQPAPWSPRRKVLFLLAITAASWALVYGIATGLSAAVAAIGGL